MIAHTQAYLRLREKSEELFNLIVVVCHAVPALKAQIRALKDGAISQLPEPDYFAGDKPVLDALLARSKNYKSVLARYVVISNFSFFEAYFKDSLQEMFEFHGGIEAFATQVKARAKKSLATDVPEIKEHKRKLQERPVERKRQGYARHSNALVDAGYQFPGELLASYGLTTLQRELDGLRSADIPRVLQEALHLDIPQDKVERFHAIRERRNDIAHGATQKSKNLSIREAIAINTDLRAFATTIDRHLVENFFVIERYAM